MANLISQVTPVGQTKDYGLRASAVQYGTCSTATGTAAKVVTCASFTSNYLVEGSIVAVKFSATNGATPSSLTLNVNNTGAKPIKFINNGALSDLPSAGYIKENLIYLFYYDGTNWVTLLNYDTNDTSSLEVVNSNPTLAWSTQSIVGSIDGTELTVTMPENPVFIVNFTEDTGTGNVTCDKTYEEIKNALMNNKNVIGLMRFDNEVFVAQGLKLSTRGTGDPSIGFNFVQITSTDSPTITNDIK